MPERFLYAHGTCGVCDYAGGLVIASPSDPRCWPCEAWALKMMPMPRALAIIAEQARALRPTVELLGIDRYEPPARRKKDLILLTQAEANGQSWRPMCKGFVGHGCMNRTVGDGEFCRRHRR